MLYRDFSALLEVIEAPKSNERDTWQSGGKSAYHNNSRFPIFPAMPYDEGGRDEYLVFGSTSKAVSAQIKNLPNP